MRNAFAYIWRPFVAGLTGAAVAGPLRAEELPEVTVTKDPSCGYCSGWVDHGKQAGFPDAVRIPEISRAKTRPGVPRALTSCHTAEGCG